MKIVGKQQEIADHFGVTIHAIEKWAARGMPGSPGDYDLGAIADWRSATMRPRVPLGESREDLARFIKAKADHTEAAAKNANFDLAGHSQIVDLDEVSTFMTAFLDQFEKQLAKLALPHVARKYDSRAEFYAADIRHRNAIVMRQMRGWLLQLDKLKITELRR